MQCFASRNRSEADLPADRGDIWEILSDPDQLAAMTPLIDRITVDGAHWCWHLRTISALGASVAPSFTERMRFTELERIDFEHDPPGGHHERAGADGTYVITELDDGRTRLAIDITLHVELPLPSLSRRAVERVMATSMERTGDRFAENLYERLGIDAADVDIRTPTDSVWASSTS